MTTSNQHTTNVMCVGPIGFPRTGQALATETWLKHSTYNIVSVDNNFEGMGKLARVFRSMALPIQVLRKTQKSKPSALYLSLKRSILGASSDLLCILAYRILITGPIIVHIHGADLKTMRHSWIGNKLIRRIWNYVSDVIVLSPKMTSQLNGLPQRQVTVVNNFSEHFADFSDVKEKIASLTSGPLNILYLSNIMYSKGFSYLIEAVKAVRAEGVEVTLVLAGQPLGDRVMSVDKAHRLLKESLGDGISYLGAIHGSDKRKALNAAHILALPTFYSIEAQPISLIEGMAFGCIPLTTRHNYNEDFLDPNAAIFVETQSAKSIAEALQNIVEDSKNTAAHMICAFKVAKHRHALETFVIGIDTIVETALDTTTKQDQEHHTSD